jgi:hypothetical protein
MAAGSAEPRGREQDGLLAVRLGLVADLVRGRTALLAENGLFRQQLIAA